MKNTLSLAIILAVVFSLVLACGGGKPAPTKYQGNWSGADGSTLYMDSGGKAGFQIGNTSVDGGGGRIYRRWQIFYHCAVWNQQNFQN